MQAQKKDKKVRSELQLLFCLVIYNQSSMQFFYKKNASVFIWICDGIFYFQNITSLRQGHGKIQATRHILK